MLYAPLLIIIVVTLAVVGQDINLTGEVTSSVSGLPLKEVIVSLESNSQCIDTTGVDGLYRLQSSTGAVHFSAGKGFFSGNRLNNGILEINVDKSQPVTVETYGLNGVLNERLLRENMIAPGLYKIDVRGSSANGNLKLIKVEQGDKTATYEVLPIKSTSGKTISASVQTGGLAKGATFIDTILFALNGFTSVRKAVTAPTGVNNIVLQPSQPQQGQTVTDADGNVYQAVTIGTQVWMAENLKTTKYNDGSAIPLVTNDPTWASLTTPGYCWYNEDTANKADYGAIYNWYVVNTGKLAPTGWHVPTNAELTALVTYLGGESLAGGKIKEAGNAHWDPPNTGATNSSGFTGRAGGCRDVDHANVEFCCLRGAGTWWSSTDAGNGMAWNIMTGLFTAGIAHNVNTKIMGYSVRCIKD